MAAPFAPVNLTKDLSVPKGTLTFGAGLNENQPADISEASSGHNFELGMRQTKLIPRAPFDLEGIAPNGGKITSIMQLITRAAVKTTLVCAADTMYSWAGADDFTSIGSVTPDALLRDTYWSLGDYLVATDVSLSNPVKKWDGTNFSNLPTGLSSPFYAKYSVVFLSRMWFFNVVAGTGVPHMIVASAFENPQNLNMTNRGGPTSVGGYSGFATGLEAFYLLTPDLKPVNGVVAFQNVLVISTVDGKLFKLTGTDAKTFEFVEFFVGSSALGTEAMCNIGNDVIYMRNGGNVDTLSGVQSFGDVRASDVSAWIPNTASTLTSALVSYDQTAQKVYFFVEGKVLVLFKDLMGGELSPWSVYTTLHPNAFNTSAVKYMQHPDQLTYSTYWGDSYGNVFDMKGVGTGGDAGAYPIDVTRRSRLIDSTLLSPFPYTERIMLGKVQYRRLDVASTLNLSFDWSDEYSASASAVPLKGPSLAIRMAVWGGFYWGDGTYWSEGGQSSDIISHQTFSPSGKGPGFYLTLSNQTAANWQVDHIEFF